MAFDQVVEDSVRGLGFELVELERQGAGLLRVTIDFPWQGGGELQRSIGVDDCERVTRQLQAVFEVEGVDYKRLEVSSPGIDRPLRRESDFERFQGERVELRFRSPIGGATTGARKRFCGVLRKSEPAGWEIVWHDEEVVSKGHRRKAVRPSPLEHVLPFTLEVLEAARLAPVLDFKGRHMRSEDVAESVDGAD